MFPRYHQSITVGTLVVVILQLIGGVFWLSAAYSQIQQNSKDISELRNKVDNGVATYLTRGQIDDLLSGRDEQIKAMQESLKRIESKIDTIKN